MKKIINQFIFITLLIIGVNLKAQIYYQDIVPDVVLNSYSTQSVLIDSSYNSVINYYMPGILQIWNMAINMISVSAPFSDCEILMNGAFPLALNYNQLISGSGSWHVPNSVEAILNNGIHGNWINAKNKYLGLRIKKGEKWIYGWIRMDINTEGTSVTIKDYACNKTPNSSIVAGQRTNSINDIDTMENNIIVYPKPFIFSTFIKSNKYLDNTIISIYDILGNKVRVIENISGKEVKIQRNNLLNGIYFIQLMQNNEIYKTLKIIIID